MQKVFKLIIDELKKAARSELKIYGGARSNGKSILLGYQKGLEDAVYIVNQTVKEYNNGWIPFKLREADEEEQWEYGFTHMLDCELPDEGQEILVTYSNGCVGIDTFLKDGFECYLDSNNEFVTEAVAWQPLPEAYKEVE